MADSPSSTNHPAVLATIENNTSITTGGVGTGILVSGANASATITGNHIYGNSTGIEFTAGGSGSVTGNDFSGTDVVPKPAANNGTDLGLDSTAGTVWPVTNNSFAGTIYIDNKSTQPINATTDTFNVGAGGAQVGGSALTVSEGYAVEDKIIDAIDETGLGLVRLRANNLYVTPNSYVSGTSSASGAVARAAAVAASGDTINVESALYLTVAHSTSIVYGTATTTLSGTITADPWVPVPVGSVSITVNGVQNSAAITPLTGTFTDNFPTASLQVAGSPYTVTYGYSGGTVGGVNYNYTTNGTRNSISDTSTIKVNPATPTISWPTPAAITYGTALGSTQLDASASWTVGGILESVVGKFVYTPPAGTVLSPGSQTLSTKFTPMDTADYTTATKSVTLEVNKAPAITSAASATFTVGKPGRFTITTTPGFPETTTLSESGPLPSGVIFKTGCCGTASLSGTPVAGSGGVYRFTISASNAPSSVTTQAFTLTVDQAPAITSAVSTTFTVGNAGSFTVTTTGYPTAALTERGGLPGGVAFVDNQDGTATLSGTPAAGSRSTYSFTIIASNGVPPESVQLFTLMVVAKSGTTPDMGSLDAATHDVAIMAVLGDLKGGTTDVSTKTGLSASDLWLLDGV